MRGVIVLGLILLATIVVAGDEQQFASKKVKSGDDEHIAASNLYRGSFFTRQDHTRPQQRDLHIFEYHANLDFYRPGGPFYVYMKDGGDYSTRWIEQGLMVDIARETGAALFTFDRRYFGNNVVTEDATFAAFEFLTIEQTLSDVAIFINEIRVAHEGRNNRVILWGSRYGATLAAWARKRYPHLIDAVWSSSGIFEIETFTFAQYDLLQYTILSMGGAECRDRVASTFEIMDYLTENGNGEYLQERLNLCHPVDTDSTTDAAALFESHILVLLYYIETMHAQGVQDFCRDMNFYQEDPFNSFARWKSHIYGHDMECFDHRYDDMVERHATTEWGVASTLAGRRQFYHQQCTQLGLFSIMDDLTWLPARLDIAYHLQKCNDIFGPEYQAILLTPANIALRTEFGSLDQRISNVIYTNGAIDPWLYNGILVSRDPMATVINIEYMAKSADLTSITNADPIGLDTAKRTIRDQIIEWSR